MTTSVIVKACCGDDKEVIVDVVDVETNENIEETKTIQDGESIEVFAYDNRRIMVEEVKK